LSVGAASALLQTVPPRVFALRIDVPHGGHGVVLELATGVAMNPAPEVSEAIGPDLASNLLDQIDQLIESAERQQRPLEVDPNRARLFELFVTAEAAGYVNAAAGSDLTADGLCRQLAERWGLRAATEESVRGQTRLPPDQLARMRSLWSVMRMWMEWTYAWQRWPEFHRGPGTATGRAARQTVEH
jgi:hypothetical protein